MKKHKVSSLFSNIIFYELVSDHVDALNLTLLAHKEMIKNKHVDLDYGINIKTDNSALVYYVKNIPVGIISFYTLESNSIWIDLSYVLSKYRKRGIWYDMRAALKEYASYLHAPAIFSGVFSNNKASLKANSNLANQCITVFKEEVKTNLSI